MTHSNLQELTSVRSELERELASLSKIGAEIRVSCKGIGVEYCADGLEDFVDAGRRAIRFLNETEMAVKEDIQPAASFTTAEASQMRREQADSSAYSEKGSVKSREEISKKDLYKLAGKGAMRLFEQVLKTRK